MPYFLLRPEFEKAYGYTHAIEIGDEIKISGAVNTAAFLEAASDRCTIYQPQFPTGTWLEGSEPKSQSCRDARIIPLLPTVEGRETR